MGGWATFLKIVKYASAVATGYEVKSFWDDEPDEKAIAKYVGEIKGIGDQKIAESIENGLEVITEATSVYLIIILVAVIMMLLLSACAKAYSCIKKNAIKEFKDDLEMVKFSFVLISDKSA